MGKRKNKNNASLALTALSVLGGLVAVIMLFLPAVAIKDTSNTYTGLQTAFGYTKGEGALKVEIFKFSFMNLLPYLLALGGLVFSALGAAGRGSKLGAIIAAAAFIAAGVFFIMSNTFCEYLFGKDVLAIAYGAIVAAVASFVAGACQLFKAIF